MITMAMLCSGDETGGFGSEKRGGTNILQESIRVRSEDAEADEAPYDNQACTKRLGCGHLTKPVACAVECDY